MIHALADVQTKNIGLNTSVWQFTVILAGARLGDHCNINCNVFIENDVEVGDYVTVKSGVQLWDGLRIGNYAHIGPNATFTNDKFPRSKVYPEEFPKIIIGDYSSIGANATILPGLRIGDYAKVGAGSVVTKDVLPHQVVVGNPAQIIGYASVDNVKVNLDLIGEDGFNYKYEKQRLIKLEQ